jgi:hypothetical protein
VLREKPKPDFREAAAGKDRSTIACAGHCWLILCQAGVWSVPFNATASTRSFMPYDYSPGYSTAVAFTNTTAGQIVVRASFTDDGGHNLGAGQIIIPAHGHAAAVLGSWQ